MIKTIHRSLILTLAFAVVLCGAYPLLVFVIGKVIFPNQSSGGILYRDGKAVGAKLIGQNFSKPQYFHGRPSSAGQNGYDATSSSGSNLGPTNQKLLKAIEDNVKKVREENPGLANGKVPVELVTASASGLDPHISPAAADVQVERVAKARNLRAEVVQQLVSSHTEGRQLGFLGQPIVNILQLNLALDELSQAGKANN